MGKAKITSDELDDDLVTTGRINKIPLPKQQVHSIDRGTGKKTVPRELFNGKEWRKEMANISSPIRKQHYYDEITDLTPFTGIDNVDSVLNMKTTNLPRSSPLVRMFGCLMCWMRGTPHCPFGVEDGKELMHPNDKDRVVGYCDYSIKSNLLKYVLMKTPDGMRHIRNINTANLENMVNYYTGKLLMLKKHGKVTQAEIELNKILIKLRRELGERIDKAIKHDEGTTLHVTRELKPSDVNRMIRMANEADEAEEVDAELVEDDEEDIEKD